MIKLAREIVWGQLKPHHKGQHKGKPSLSDFHGKNRLKRYREKYGAWYNALPEVKAKKVKYAKAKSATMKRLGIKSSQVLSVGRTKPIGRKPRGKKVLRGKPTRFGKRGKKR